jgi:hypothetical protein
MSDLPNRLRGKYRIGPDSEYGERQFAHFIPPICIEAADRIEELEKLLTHRDGGDHDNDCKIYSNRGCNCGHNSVVEYFEKHGE